MPKVSVLLPVHNGDKYLPKSIQSVLIQSFADLEVLILNDDSTDNSLKIINQFAVLDKRIKAIDFKKHIGLVRILNEGIKKAQGLYLARIDSDDEWSDVDKIKKQVEFMEKNPDYALVGTNALVINEKGDIIGKIVYPEKNEVIRRKILIKNQFLHSSVMFRKKVAKKCGLYDQEEKYVEDYGLWLRIGQYYKFANLPFYGLKYRLNPQGETATKNRQQVINSFKLVKKFKNKYPNFILACVKWILRYFKTFFRI